MAGKSSGLGALACYESSSEEEGPSPSRGLQQQHLATADKLPGSKLHQQEHKNVVTVQNCKRKLDDHDEEDKDTKRTRTQDLEKRTLPSVPADILQMFSDKRGMEGGKDNPEEHGGRIRSFPHIAGNWATHVYVSFEPDSEFTDGVRHLLGCVESEVQLQQAGEYHISLSRTVPLTYHWIQPFIDELRETLRHTKRFFCTFQGAKLYTNDEKTRSFLGLEVTGGHNHLLQLVAGVDRCLGEFRLQKYYQNPSFHMTVGWCVGNAHEDTQQFNHKLQASLAEAQEEFPSLAGFLAQEIKCRSGNRLFSFPLR
ncbi:PREDICTED: U6 snRNA phosphodiesterase-like [Branchiostoma belcheri]|uniref:U6 snRNA phosphodiesterase n=1 Tax=Branchiostoma belcheri TaxID=7741 RepID=A0A6P5A133_BRABE|nr:PREDICTED: U6 snRNA phosphodiesterase-like [Branchiostoma belcheri]